VLPIVVFQDMEGELQESICEIVATESGLVQSGWFFWGMNVLHSLLLR
jgi:hypothetical protein